MYLVLQSPVKRIKATESDRVSFTKATKIADNDFHERYIFLTAMDGMVCEMMRSVRYHDARGIFVTWTTLSKINRRYLYKVRSVVVWLIRITVVKYTVMFTWSPH